MVAIVTPESAPFSLVTLSRLPLIVASLLTMALSPASHSLQPYCCLFYEGFPDSSAARALPHLLSLLPYPLTVIFQLLGFADGGEMLL